MILKNEAVQETNALAQSLQVNKILVAILAHASTKLKLKGFLCFFFIQVLRDTISCIVQVLCIQSGHYS